MFEELLSIIEERFARKDKNMRRCIVKKLWRIKSNKFKSSECAKYYISMCSFAQLFGNKKLKEFSTIV